MRPLDGLRAEHEKILAFLDETENTRDAEEFVRVLDFVRRFVEANHHGKEERALFSRMAADPFLHGMADALHQDHELGNALIAEIENALREHADLAVISDAFATYARYLRHHIARENTMIFEAVEAVLDERTAAEMLVEFDQIEKEALALR